MQVAAAVALLIENERWEKELKVREDQVCVISVLKPSKSSFLY